MREHEQYRFRQFRGRNTNGRAAGRRSQITSIPLDLRRGVSTSHKNSYSIKYQYNWKKTRRDQFMTKITVGASTNPLFLTVFRKDYTCKTSELNNRIEIHSNHSEPFDWSLDPAGSCLHLSLPTPCAIEFIILYSYQFEASKSLRSFLFDGKKRFSLSLSLSLS